MKPLLFIFTLLLVSSCLKGHGNELEKENVVVYFDEGDESYAQKLLDFWIRNKYNGKRKQYVKISRRQHNKSYLVKVILRDDFNPNEITFREIELFNQIQEELNESVFVKKPCELAICDKYFKVLKIPNPINP